MEHNDLERIIAVHIEDILNSVRHAATNHGLQPADAEACEVDFELHMRDPERIDEWASTGFSLAWLNACAEHFASNYRRGVDTVRGHELGDSAAQAEAAGIESQAPGPERKVQIGEVQRELDVSLARLPDTHRMMITMRVTEQRTYAEIGASFGTTPDAARKTVKRALAVVKSYLEHAGFDWAEGMRILESPPPRDPDSEDE
jgi:RNA polymerase sigma factor (sigma-70 family)